MIKTYNLKIGAFKSGPEVITLENRWRKEPSIVSKAE